MISRWGKEGSVSVCVGGWGYWGVEEIEKKRFLHNGEEGSHTVAI